ncbi:DNA lyase-like protein [Halenospora varia]|nr:DNA lyase-like protein [Halenospora varia]
MMEARTGLRITTWNVNGIRNPFGYQPWRQERTFAAMFEILEADIVVMQETKIQRKDLQDDMVLVPGWDVFFSLPKHKKGYSGVAIYTRNSICAPIRAEEGITGILTPPNSTTSFRDLPEDQQIGGYPLGSQLQDSEVDPATLDSEGRCVVLEFPAFVLIGTYCPANRDESRDEFRIGFLNALDARVRNLVAMGKRVFLCGDLNIIRDGMDTAKAEEQLKKEGLTMDQYLSTPARRMLNQFVVGGKVIGEKDEGRDKQVMWDICRSFHPNRKGMFTCWEQKINARPGNFGSRIDYVLCSVDFYDWFSDSNIQEGLMGSDHCPVYAVFKDKVDVHGKEVDIRDLMSDGMFKDGVRLREWSTKDLLQLSAKLIPEFDKRRTIRDMFSKKPTLSTKESSMSTTDSKGVDVESQLFSTTEAVKDETFSTSTSQAPESPTVARSFSRSESQASSINTSPAKPSVKRPNEINNIASRPLKRGKSASTSKASTANGKAQGKGQSSLMGFFKPKTPQVTEQAEGEASSAYEADPSTDSTTLAEVPLATAISAGTEAPAKNDENSSPKKSFDVDAQDNVVDPIIAKESWSKLLTGKRVVPRCEHNEPCKSMLTKKPGINCGRSFYMCSRPLGPTGQKEKDTQWRCGTFIWSSDWSGGNGGAP